MSLSEPGVSMHQEPDTGIVGAGRQDPEMIIVKEDWKELELGFGGVGWQEPEVGVKWVGQKELEPGIEGAGWLEPKLGGRKTTVTAAGQCTS